MSSEDFSYMRVDRIGHAFTTTNDYSSAFKVQSKTFNLFRPHVV